MLYLSNLYPGKYVLEIRSNYSSENAYLIFEITPVFHQTYAFRISLFIFILIVISLVVYYFSKRSLNKKNAKQKRAEKMAALEVKAYQTQLNPHFIFNCLNSIQSLFLSGDELKANKYLSNFSFLLRNILESSDKIFTTIMDEQKMLESYLALEKLQFDQGLNYQINIEDSKSPNFMIPANLLQPIIENSLKHGISKISDVGNIDINIKSSSHYTVMEVIDNGGGLNSNDSERIKNHESKGLKLINERVLFLEKYHNLDIEFTIGNNPEKQGVVAEIRFKEK